MPEVATDHRLGPAGADWYRVCYCLGPPKWGPIDEGFRCDRVDGGEVVESRKTLPRFRIGRAQDAVFPLCLDVKGGGRRAELFQRKARPRAESVIPCPFAAASGHG